MVGKDLNGNILKNISKKSKKSKGGFFFLKDDIIRHYDQLIQATEQRIEKLRKESEHFSKIDDELTYLFELRKRREGVLK